jgi:saxitoxin biosynthesis operon SxtJ-like protein
MIDPELPEDAPPVDARQLRQFAGLWLLVWSGMAAWQLVRGHSTRAVIFAGVAVGLGVAGLIRPEAIRPVFALLSAVTRPIGLVMTRVVLGVAYYGLVTPLALFFRVTGRDPLARTRRSGATTHWTPRSGKPEPRRYLRQV